MSDVGSRRHKMPHRLVRRPNPRSFMLRMRVTLRELKLMSQNVPSAYKRVRISLSGRHLLHIAAVDWRNEPASSFNANKVSVDEKLIDSFFNNVLEAGKIVPPGVLPQHLVVVILVRVKDAKQIHHFPSTVSNVSAFSKL